MFDYIIFRAHDATIHKYVKTRLHFFATHLHFFLQGTGIISLITTSEPGYAIHFQNIYTLLGQLLG